MERPFYVLKVRNGITLLAACHRGPVKFISQTIGATGRYGARVIVDRELVFLLDSPMGIDLGKEFFAEAKA